LAKFVDLEPKPESDQQKVQEFLQASCVDQFVLEESVLSIKRGVNSFDYRFGGISTDVPNGALLLRETAAAEANRLQRLLDGPYQVHPFEFGFVVEHTQDQSFLILHHNHS
jgi:hypothetical protein